MGNTKSFEEIVASKASAIRPKMKGYAGTASTAFSLG